MGRHRGSSTAPQYDPRIEVRGRGPLVVYVPGIDGTGRLFYRQEPRLVAAGYRVVTYRLRDEATQMSRLVDDLHAVIDAALAGAHAGDDHASDVTLVAESFGGPLALSYALAYPDRIGRMVILNSFPFFRPQRRLKLGVFALRLVGWRTMAVVRRLTALFLHSPHTHREEIRQFLLRTDETTTVGYANRLRILMEVDVRDRLSELHVPVLYLASDRDHLVPAVQQGRLMQSLTPRSQLRVLEGHGHICLIAPGIDIAAALTDWRPPPGAQEPPPPRVSDR